MKRFLCGVEGVSEVGKDVLEELLGGVCDREGSFIVVACDCDAKFESAVWFGAIGCGIVVSNISARNKVENVRFASSAAKLLAICFCSDGNMLTFLKVKFSMRCAFL